MLSLYLDLSISSCFSKAQFEKYFWTCLRRWNVSTNWIFIFPYNHFFLYSQASHYLTPTFKPPLRLPVYFSTCWFLTHMKSYLDINLKNLFLDLSSASKCFNPSNYYFSFQFFFFFSSLLVIQHQQNFKHLCTSAVQFIPQYVK